MSRTDNRYKKAYLGPRQLGIFGEMGGVSGSLNPIGEQTVPAPCVGNPAYAASQCFKQPSLSMLGPLGLDVEGFNFRCPSSRAKTTLLT